MINYETPADFEAQIFKKLKKRFPTVTGYVSSVHVDPVQRQYLWLSVYIYLLPSGDESEVRFEQLVQCTNYYIKRLWPEPICRHPRSKGRDKKGKYFYTFWLPVPPGRHATDFAHFSLHKRP